MELTETQIISLSNEIRALLRSQDWKYRMDRNAEYGLIREAVEVALKRAEGYDSPQPEPKEVL